MYEAWDGDQQHGIDGCELVVTLEIRDNFAINAKKRSEGQDFWFIFCTKSLHIVKKVLKFKWVIEFEERDEVVVKKYYRKWGDSKSSYVLLKDSHVVYMYVHLMRAIKFLMRPKNHWVFGNDIIFELPPDASYKHTISNCIAR